MKIVLYRNLNNNIQGNYYLDWLESLEEAGYKKITLFEFIFFKANYSKVVISHTLHDLFINDGFKYIILNFVSFLISKIVIFKIKKENQEVILFSKNDYKDFNKKVNFFRSFNNAKIVTHTKKAKKIFTDQNIDAHWMPFGFRKEKLKKHLNASLRPIDIGFRGNLNSQWNDSQREHLIERILNSNLELNFDINPSKNGENFLFGEDYYSWIANCNYLINSPSAFDTVGPRFYEQMFLGAVPISIFNSYEGILFKDKNYVCIDINYDDKEIKNKLMSKEIFNKIKNNNHELVKKFDIPFLIQNSSFL